MMPWNCMMQTAFNRVEKSQPDNFGLLYRVFHVSDCVLMQFTGLRDKNGQEIYEGDIVAWHQFKITVEWNPMEARFGFPTEYSLRQHEVEIIGNIHENPELLK